MAENDYKVHKVFFKEIDFELFILEIPGKEVEDKLAYFAKEKGYIPKAYYDDYVLATCVANINQLLHKISTQKEEKPIDVKALRDQIIAIVLEHNPLLKYDNIVINKNKVLKLKTGRLKKEEKLLKDNKYWEATDTVEFVDEDEKSKSKSIVPKDKAELKNIQDLEYTLEKEWWKRIGRYIEIKKFAAEDLPSLSKDRFFHNRTSFSTFVVTMCVVDFEGLFQLLDSMGIPSRVAPPLLVHELYLLCAKINPFLTFDNAQDLVAESFGEKDEKCGGSCKDKSKDKEASSASMEKYAKDSKQKKRFKDVPKEDLLSLPSSMKVSLIGQDKAVDSLCEAIQRASVGLKDPKKPIGSFLFAGSTGCGKSLTAKALANELIKDRNNLLTIDCSEYSAEHEYSKLIGSPSGYVGFEQGGILTNAILKNPFSVIVFDEIEKASHKVFQLLLQVLDEGRLTDNKGVTVSFKDTVIIMTSNIGVKDVEAIGKTIGFGDVSKVTQEKKDKAIGGALKNKFKPEFLNRIDEIIYFNDLTKDDYFRIIDIELYKLNDNLQANDTVYKALTLDFDSKVKQVIYDEGVNEEYGARPLKRAIEKLVSTPLAVQLLSGKIEVDSVVKVSAEKNFAIFAFEKKVDDPPFYMAQEENKAEGK